MRGDMGIMERKWKLLYYTDISGSTGIIKG